jgi:hypothetical protein
LLTLAGKEILLKAIVQAIPSYSMSVFLLPVSLCKDLNRLMQSFWWGHLSNDSKIHWMSWSKLGRSKSAGGLGFRDLYMFNKALLAKQCWRLIQNPVSLIAQIIRAKYYPHSSFLESHLGRRPSFIWRSFMAAKELLSHGIHWRIGDGRSIKIWGDNWVPNIGSLSVPPESNHFSDALVSNVIDSFIPNWNGSIIDNLFPTNVAKIIKNIPLCTSLPPDKIFWSGTSNGMFSVRSAYHLGLDLLRKQKGECSFRIISADFWKKLWALKVPNSSKIFLWRACQNLLPTKQNLLKKCVLKDDLCPCCKFQEESIIHALWSCPSAQDVWGSGSLVFQKCPSSFPGMVELVSFLFNKLDDGFLSLMVAVFRSI